MGTGHVFAIQDAVRDAILALRPDIVFVELDKSRLAGLLQRRSGQAPPSGGGFVHKRLQRFQEQVASWNGSDVGGEMVAAVEAARMVGARVALIDPPADQTVQRALKSLTWRERFRALGLILKGSAQALLPRRLRGDDKERVEAEIRKYQQDPQAALAELKQNFPSVYRVVIDERDQIMARRIRRGLGPACHGVAIVGDGHVPGLAARLSDLHPTVYRLSDVREARLPKPDTPTATGGPGEVSFGFDVQL